MSLVVFKYCLPLVLGYVVFIFVSGSLHPWTKPQAPSGRPAWFLGLWQGGVAALTLATLSHIAWQAPLYEVLDSLQPLAGGALLAMLAGGALALAYRQLLGRAVSREARGTVAAETTLGHEVTGELHAADTAPGIIAADEQAITDCEVHTLALAEDETRAMADLRSELQTETLLRVETEKHLRITRKALHVLESQARDHEAARTDAMIGLEEELESQVRHKASAESRLQRELERVATLEVALIDAKHELLESKRNLRQGMQARAKALATAHKALAHARRALHARSRMESRISEMQAALGNRQQTITSLIKTLEQEKSRSDAQINERARQLLMQQRQLQARRAVEDAASTGSIRHGSRLIKRIATARRIEGSAN